LISSLKGYALFRKEQGFPLHSAVAQALICHAFCQMIFFAVRREGPKTS